MDKPRILDRLRNKREKAPTVEEFKRRYNTIVNDIASKYSRKDSIQTDKMRGIPARERINRETQEEEIVYLVNQDEAVYQISPADLHKLITEARNDPQLSEFISLTMNVKPDNLPNFFNNFGIYDIIHEGKITATSDERRLIRHTVQQADPNGGGTVLSE